MESKNDIRVLKVINSRSTQGYNVTVDEMLGNLEKC